jgi:hypothetical protein
MLALFVLGEYWHPFYCVYRPVHARGVKSWSVGSVNAVRSCCIRNVALPSGWRLSGAVDRGPLVLFQVQRGVIMMVATNACCLQNKLFK